MSENKQILQNSDLLHGFHVRFACDCVILKTTRDDF
jgi:hypothetical protein